MTKAITYYRLKEDEIGKDRLTKTKLITETAETYNVPNSVLRRRITKAGKVSSIPQVRNS